MGMHTDDEYLSTVFFEDRDDEITARARSIVVTRAPHRCSYADVIGKPHEISPGTRAIAEWAVVNGEPGRWWACLPCLDTWLDEIKRET